MSRMAKKYLRRVSEFLVIRDMQVKTVLRFYLSPVRMARVKKTASRKYQRGRWEKAPSFAIGSTAKCSIHGHQHGEKLNVNLPYTPAIPLLSI